MQTRNKLLAYLAGAAFSVSADINASGTLSGDAWSVPESLLNEILDEVEGTGWKDEDRLVLLAVLAKDARIHVRARVSELLSVGQERRFEDLEPLLLSLAGDIAQEVRGAVSRTVAAELAKSDGLTRTRVAAEWALSDSWAVRDTAARTLARDFHCLCTESVVSHLAEDPHPEVRETVVQTAIARFEENPVHYAEILELLASDSHRRVRRAARRAEIALS